MNTNLKLLLVDDHAMLRRGLRETLSRQPSLTLVGEAWSGAMALQLVKELKPDLILMDVHLPDTDGIAASRQILKDHPGIKIIIFSSDTVRTLVDEALQAGVCGYLSKTGSVEELMLAIDTVTSGNLYLSPEISGDILKDYQKGLLGEKQDSKPLLSDRDKHLLRLIAEGHRNKEISAELDIGIKSVEAYRSRLMKKLSCASSAELIRYAVREGIAKL
jgi:DNA-binding NarL/FixJ family response regulator